MEVEEELEERGGRVLRRGSEGEEASRRVEREGGLGEGKILHHTKVELQNGVFARGNVLCAVTSEL